MPIISANAEGEPFPLIARYWAQAEEALLELKGSGELEAAQLDAAAAKAKVANMTARLKEVRTCLIALRASMSDCRFLELEGSRT